MAGASLAPGEAGATPNQRKRKAPPAPAAAAEGEAEAEEAERELADLDRRALEHIRGTATAPGEAGATPNQRKRKAPPAPAAAAEAEAEAEELERELADLDRRTLEHTRGTATRLVTAAVSHLAALRPPATLEVSMASRPFDDDQEWVEKLKILKSKMEANVADLPMVLDKMKDSISRWERLQNLNVNIHPVFQRKT